MELLRPDLALRGFALTQHALTHEWARAALATLRERVLARAHQDLAREHLETHPGRAIKRALSRHDNLLSGYELARARAWVNQEDAAQVGERVIDLLHGQEDITARVARFLVSPIALGGKRTASINETVTSYLLAMAHPQTYAFAKPESAMQPAWRLLMSPEGERLPTGPERQRTVTDFYSALRELWHEQAGFEGDLLDVHWRLMILGSGAREYDAFSWARAVSVDDLRDMVTRAQDPAWRDPFHRAAELMREVCFDSNRLDDPFHGLSVDDWAHVYGGKARTLAWILEYGTPELARLTLDSADAFGVSFGEGGRLRVQGQDGASREEAEAFFETRVMPRHKELVQVARVMMDEAAEMELAYFAREHYRSLDGKLLLLILCAFDPDWTYLHISPATRATELVRLGELLGAPLPPIKAFTDYLEAQALLSQRASSGSQGVLPLGALTLWCRENALGRMLMGYLEGSDSAVGALDEALGAEAPMARAVPGDPGSGLGDEESAILEPAPSAQQAWEEFIAGVVEPEQERLARLLRARKNVVLYGPPGTGKTVLSTRLGALWRRWQRDDLAGTPSVEQVTFHPSYGYEEFIEGFRPMPEEVGRFELRPGLLVTLAQRAQAEPSRNFLLLIDELNRGDVARIFGELITLIEADKRSPEHARRRMLSQEPLWLPPNLHLLATMNTADKSISLLDVAVRRRFAFERVAPEPGLLDRTPGLVHEVQGVYMSALLGALNTRLEQIGVYPERWLGHSFLWIEERGVEDPLVALSSRLRLDIIPMVEEYCFADRRQMREVLGSLVDRQGRPDDALLESSRLIPALRALIEDVRDEDEGEEG